MPSIHSADQNGPRQMLTDAEELAPISPWVVKAGLKIELVSDSDDSGPAVGFISVITQSLGWLGLFHLSFTLAASDPCSTEYTAHELSP